MNKTTNNTELESLITSWEKTQSELRPKLKLTNSAEWQKQRCLRLVGGMDISFDKSNPSTACCSLVVCHIGFNHIDVVYEDSTFTNLTLPYIPGMPQKLHKILKNKALQKHIIQLNNSQGFLAFRELEPCVRLYKKLTLINPELTPDVIIFDGNGVLHPRGLGLASHFGVLEDVCTIGAAKNLYQMNDILRDEDHKSKILLLEKPGDHFFLGGNSAQDSLGAALKTTESAKRPMYVSIGNKIDLETAIWTVMQCCVYARVPEPTRQADILSRKMIRYLKDQKLN